MEMRDLDAKERTQPEGRSIIGPGFEAGAVIRTKALKFLRYQAGTNSAGPARVRAFQGEYVRTLYRKGTARHLLRTL